MFRTLLVGALTALALSSVAVGTAQAAPAAPVLAADSAACSTARSSLASVQLQVDEAQKAYNDRGDVTEAAAKELLDKLNGLKVTLGEKQRTVSRECGSGGNGNWNGNGPRYNSCDDYHRHGIRELSRNDVRYDARWDRNHDGWACRNDDVVVSENGDCVTYRTTNRDYGTRYNNRVRDLTNDARRSNSDGGTTVTNDEWRRIQNAQDVRDYRNRWTSSRDQLRTVCNDDSPEVVIVDKPDPVVVTTTPAPAPEPISNPIPRSSSGQVSRMPSGPADTGDGSTVLG
jgi:hypothetical protein